MPFYTEQNQIIPLPLDIADSDESAHEFNCQSEMLTLDGFKVPHVIELQLFDYWKTAAGANRNPNQVIILTSTDVVTCSELQSIAKIIDVRRGTMTMFF